MFGLVNGLNEQELAIFNFVQNKLGLNLNEGQQKLVIPNDKETLCSAVPGSGKTTSLGVSVVLKELIGKVPGNRIYVMTFTNKATTEFKNRHRFYMEKLGLKSLTHVSTIHSMCKRYVEIFHTKLGMMSAETLDEEDARKKMQRVIATVFDKKENQVSMTLVNDVMGVIGYLNNKLYFKKEEIVKTYNFINLDMDYDKFETIREVYHSSQRRSGVLGFDEWMLAFYELLRDHADVREAVQNQLDALFVDEFQDTSLLQFEIIRMMKGPKASITAVGDNDQSIYKWRGASDVYQEFMNHFPNFVHVEMNINYRCPEFVIESANALIRNNTKRLPVKAKGTGKKGKLEIVPTNSNQRSAKVIAKRVMDDYLKGGRDNNILLEKLVLYRNHSQGMFLVYELASHEIPVLTGGVTLPHKDKIVKDILEIVHFLSNPRSSFHASKCMHMVSTQINKPKSPDKCPFNVSTEKEHFAEVHINVKNKTEYQKELQQLTHASKMIREGKPAFEVFNVLIPLYMNAYYKKFRINELMGRTDEDVDSIVNFLIHGVDKSYDIDQFRYLLNKAEQFVNNSNKDQIGLKVYSVHAAKGLESNQVYLLDVNGTLQPSRKVIDKLKEARAYEAIEDYINEERSLMFVAITRSLRDLFVTYNHEIPSPFNWESGLNEKLVVKKEMISLKTLGIKKNENEKTAVLDSLIDNKAGNTNNKSINTPTEKPSTNGGLNKNKLPNSVLAMLNQTAPATSYGKTDADILNEINQITDNLGVLTDKVERREMKNTKSRLDGVIQ